MVHRLIAKSKNFILNDKDRQKLNGFWVHRLIAKSSCSGSLMPVHCRLLWISRAVATDIKLTANGRKQWSSWAVYWHCQSHFGFWSILEQGVSGMRSKQSKIPNHTTERSQDRIICIHRASKDPRPFFESVMLCASTIVTIQILNKMHAKLISVAIWQQQFTKKNKVIGPQTNCSKTTISLRQDDLGQFHFP